MLALCCRMASCTRQASVDRQWVMARGREPDILVRMTDIIGSIFVDRVQAINEIANDGCRFSSGGSDRSSGASQPQELPPIIDRSHSRFDSGVDRVSYSVVIGTEVERQSLHTDTLYLGAHSCWQNANILIDSGLVGLLDITKGRLSAPQYNDIGGNPYKSI